MPGVARRTARDAKRRRVQPDGGRGRRPALDAGAIVGAVVRVADADGLEAVAMRRLAAELDAGTMSLYRHLARKDELFDLALERVWGEIEVPDRPSGDWRADLSSLARQTRSMLSRHPWAAALLASRPPLGESYLRWFEFSLAVLAGRGLALRDSLAAIGTLNAYVAGFAGYEAGDARARRRHGLREDELRARVRPRLEPLLASGRFPQLARFVREGSGEASDAGFEFGLAVVLDGLERALPALGRPAPRPRRPRP